MSEIINIEALPLETLGMGVAESSEAAEAAIGKAVQHALRCGKYLSEAKSRLSHGEWLPWLDRFFHGDPRTAQRWMRVAENATRVPNLSDASSIRDALRMIADFDRPDTTEAAPEPAREPQQAPEPERETIDPEQVEQQERPSIAVSRPETRKTSEADRPKPAPVAAVLHDMWVHDHSGYRPATPHEVASAAIDMMGTVGLRAYVAKQEVNRRGK